MLSACSGHAPEAQDGGGQPVIYPDYVGVTVPVNIAPLNFRVEGVEDAYVTLDAGGRKLVSKGVETHFPLHSWHRLLEAAAGSELIVTVFGKNDGKWLHFQPFTIDVSPEPVDRYVSYRLIEPTYGMSGYMCLAQRDLTSFREKEFYNNSLDFERGGKGQCVNCHSFQNWHTDNMQFHVRQHDGGTVVVRDGKALKIALRGPGMISAGVYPSWHPTLPLIAYSVNKTNQYFFSTGPEKTEVVDSGSDIFLFDPDALLVTPVCVDQERMETFPYWSPDGDRLYYCSADLEGIEFDPSGHIAEDCFKVRYSIYSRPFNPQDRSFGEETVEVDAASQGTSATFPRLNPDGRHLLFTRGSFGNFHIWHKDADLWLKDLRTGECRPLDEVNSDCTESYHSWSSTGRWMVFSSRRGDNTYTRLYLAWFGPDGIAGKPFVMPQKNPGYYDKLFKSYNIPEFTVDAVDRSPRDFASVVCRPAVNLNQE